MNSRLRELPLTEPLPPRDRVSYLEARIRVARAKVSELRSTVGLACYVREIDRLNRQIFDWKRELRELRQ